ncbi:MAG: uncharacterized protein KVP18_003173 [Porospora cf. gigantea A]|uniref:uncharacterized protein n=1 Tax=Porospora cf. gigantea A TaxID=2853593 RepID=UPI0035596ADF|nr:MAG: hypothetical protein KVP18_003173 [Porospora cf. gigantea A]
MVVLVLKVKVDMENMSEVVFPANLEWCFDLQNPSGSDIKTEVTLDPTETILHQRSSVHLLMKWVKDSKHPATMTLVNIPKKVKDVAELCAEGRKLTEAQSGLWVAVLAMECRGLEPVAWHPNATGISGKSIGGTRFADVDMSTREWYDYDADNEVCVSVTGLEFKFET